MHLLPPITRIKFAAEELEEEITNLKTKLDHANNLLEEFASCGVSLNEPQLDYVEIQVPREFWTTVKQVYGER